ncbi:methionyl-tRNA formyltransferase [Idiomarina abyssalis]|uniref:methionyl-tRNA formyltransferase n=1 Tax=Idiomarina abyssalis TaxID=86102 RepID=UPI003A910056
MNIGFFLIGKKGFYALDKFIETFSASKVAYVVSARDPNIENDFYSEIRLLCSKNNIALHDRGEIFSHDADYTFAIGWKWILDESNLIVLHDSLLPKYRGFAPLVNMLVNGEEKIGVTALKASDEYDKGDIIRQKSVEVSYPLKIKEAIDLILPLYSDLVIGISNEIISGKRLSLKAQNEEDASYSLWRNVYDYQINWTHNAEKIERFIDAVGDPYAGAHTYLNNEEVVILEAASVDDVVVEDRDAHIGKVVFLVEGLPTVVCGKGLLQINSIVDKSGNELTNRISFRSRFGLHQ